MKKHFTFYSIGWLVVLFEIILCIVFALSVVLVNGTDNVGKDHASLLFLVTLTVASIVLMKSGKRFLNKAVLGIAILPLLAIGYEVMITFLLPAHAQLAASASHSALASILLF